MFNILTRSAIMIYIINFTGDRYMDTISFFHKKSFIANSNLIIKTEQNSVDDRFGEISGILC